MLVARRNRMRAHALLVQCLPVRVPLVLTNCFHSLRGVEIGDDEAAVIGKALEANTTLKTLE